MAEGDNPPPAAIPPVAAAPPVTAPRKLVPPAPEQHRPALLPASLTLTGDEIMRLRAAAGIGALLLAGGGFALGRRSGLKAQLAMGAIAKAPTWQAVMPPDLAGSTDATMPPLDRPGEAAAQAPTEPAEAAPDPGRHGTVAADEPSPLPAKRVKRGRAFDQFGRMATGAEADRAAKRKGARGPGVVFLSS